MKKLLLLSLVASCTVASAQAYIDANVGVNTSWNSLGLNVDAGYMFNKYLGAEGGVTYSPGYSYTWGPYSYTTNYYMFDAAAKGVLPLSSIFSLYGKLGIGINNYSSGWSGCPGCGSPDYSGSNVGVLIGVGAQFNLSKQWALHVEDATVTGPNPNLLMFGGQFNF